MHIYAGLFLVTFSALSLELTLVRLLSVITWYHLAFFAISTAMLGMTAGATRVYLRPKVFTEDAIAEVVGKASVHFALSIPVTIVLLCLLPVSLSRSVMGPVALLVATVVCALPFYFVGTIVSAVLTKCSVPIGKLYASDLAGASLGCLFVLGGLELLDAPSLGLLCGSVGALGGACFLAKGTSRWVQRGSVALCMALLVASVGNSITASGIRPVFVKNRVELAHTYLLERWNSFSRVAVQKESYEPPQYWGPSPLAPKDPTYQYDMTIDGEAGTVVQRFLSRADIDHLRYDVTNVAYYLGREGKAFIIGVGGGRDVQSALLFGHAEATGIDINPIFIDLLQDEFRRFAGIADHPGVRLVADEARSFLSRDEQKYAIIQMSLIDTWAATGAGAFSLSENSLYTVEAWLLFLDRLAENGIFTVSRWHSPSDIGETGRLTSLAVAALLRRGVQDPSEHLALISSGGIATLLVSRRPLAKGDLDRLDSVCADLRFRIIHLPRRLPAATLLRKIVTARTEDQLSAAIQNTELNCTPPTDESPYFFNMLRLRNIGRAFSRPAGVVRGNLLATLTLLTLLLTLLVVTVATIVVPLLLRSHFGIHTSGPSPTLWTGAVYFALIGAGFMLTEIALIQRLTVFLSHPMYALGILLFTLIASTGIGSLLSDHLPLNRSPWLYLYPLLTSACLIGVRFLLSLLLASMMSSTILARILMSIAVIFPMGLLMGLFFPTGMRLAKSVRSGETPWYWALNGILGVLCSALAVLISIYIGVSANFYMAAVCYGTVALVQLGWGNAKAVAARKRAQCVTSSY